MKRCAAPVPASAIALRSLDSPLDARCLRTGKVQLGGKWFCTQHAPAWSVHYAILERIRNL